MWLFNGVEFDGHIDGYHGFVYLLVDKENGYRYIGKKSFWAKKSIKGKSRKVTVESNWKNYYSSSKTIKELVKQSGKDRFERHILALCKLERHMNYLEVKYQFMYNVIESDGWYNENINGKWYPHLYKDIKDECLFSNVCQR